MSILPKLTPTDNITVAPVAELSVDLESSAAPTPAKTTKATIRVFKAGGGSTSNNLKALPAQTLQKKIINL